MTGRYDDIINLPHHVSKNRRHMSMVERGAQFSPFAALTGYDLSVISRATASKYVMAPSGIYPLKFFFNERPKADDDVTSHQIIDAIKTIITEEDKRTPLPDETIASILSERGFNIARRTVAKYRERLGLPVARLRKTI